MFLLLLTTTHLVTASPPTSCISGEPLPKPSPLPPDLQYLQWSQIDRAVFYNCYEKVVEFYDEYEGEPWRIPHASLKIGAHEGHVKIVEALLERENLHQHHHHQPHHHHHHLINDVDFFF